MFVPSPMAYAEIFHMIQNPRWQLARSPLSRRRICRLTNKAYFPFRSPSIRGGRPDLIATKDDGILDGASYIRSGVQMGFSRWEYELVEPAQVGSILVPPESALVFDMRLMGVARSIRVESRSRLTLPVSYCGLVCAVATRMPMFIGLAATCASLQLFQIKMVSMADAVAFVFMHTDALYRVLRRPRSGRRDGSVGSLLLWLVS